MNDPRRLHVFWRNRADAAVLSGGGWLSAMPLERMQTESLSDVARSVDLDPVNTRFAIALDQVRPVRGIFFGPTNMTARAKVQIVQTDPTFTDILADYGTRDFGTRVPFGSLPYGAPHTYDGFVPWKDADRLPWAIRVFDSRLGARHLSIRIDDQSNPDGHIDIGRLYVMDAYVPSFNYSYGNNGLSLVDNSISSKAIGGAKHFWRLPNKRRFQCQLEILPENEAFGPFWEMINHSGYDRECFVVPDPGDTANLQTRSFAGRFFQLDQIAQTHFQRAGGGFGIEEL